MRAIPYAPPLYTPLVFRTSLALRGQEGTSPPARRGQFRERIAGDHHIRNADSAP
jgi:hypothetical protein